MGSMMPSINAYLLDLLREDIKSMRYYSQSEYQERLENGDCEDPYNDPYIGEPIVLDEHGMGPCRICRKKIHYRSYGYLLYTPYEFNLNIEILRIRDNIPICLTCRWGQEQLGHLDYPIELKLRILRLTYLHWRFTQFGTNITAIKKSIHNYAPMEAIVKRETIYESWIDILKILERVEDIISNTEFDPIYLGS